VNRASELDDGKVVTDPLFWDCDCEHFYIHAKMFELHCPLCGASEEDFPDSRVNEIAEGLAMACRSPMYGARVSPAESRRRLRESLEKRLRQLDEAELRDW
jgi:hypothetical protein